jgi:hypothetical protein
MPSYIRVVIAAATVAAVSLGLAACSDDNRDMGPPSPDQTTTSLVRGTTTTTVPPSNPVIGD